MLEWFFFYWHSLRGLDLDWDGVCSELVGLLSLVVDRLDVTK